MEPSVDLVNASPDAMILADRDGTIRVWNPAAQRVFGFTAEQAIGANLDIIIPERFREAHWAGFERAIDEGRTKYDGQALATRAQRADGQQIYVELAFSIVLAEGRGIGALATARDITQRFEQDRELRRELRALREASAAGGVEDA